MSNSPISVSGRLDVLTCFTSYEFYDSYLICFEGAGEFFSHTAVCFIIRCLEMRVASDFSTTRGADDSEKLI